MPINAGDTTAEVKATIDQIIEDAGLDPADNTDTTAATSMLNEIAVLYDLPGLTGRMGGAAAREVINNLEAGGGGSPVDNRQQIAGLSGYPTRAVANTNSYTQVQAKKLFYPFVDVSDLTFRVGNLFRTSAGSANLPDVTVKMAVWDGALYYPITWGGASTITLAANEVAECDPVVHPWEGGAFTRGEPLWIVKLLSYASAPSNFPAHSGIIANSGADQNEWGNALVDHTAGAGSWPGTRPAGNYDLFPMLSIKGTPIERTPVVAILGDSISVDAANDSLQDLYQGWAAIGLARAGIPYLTIGISSLTLFNWLGAGNTAVRERAYSLLQMAGVTHVLAALGTNDWAGPRTAEQLYADKLTLKAELEAIGIKTVPITLYPKTNAANTTYNGTETGTFANRVAYNDLIRTNNGVGDGYIDIAAVTEDATDENLWRTDLLKVTGATVAAGGTGYANSDVLHFDKGIMLRVGGVSAGAITSLSVRHGGSGFPVAPANPLAPIYGHNEGFGVASAGTGALINMTTAAAGLDTNDGIHPGSTLHARAALALEANANVFRGDAPWTDRSSGAGTGTYADGVVTLVSLSGVDRAAIDTPIETIAGETYEFSINVTAGPSAGLNLKAASAPNGGSVILQLLGLGLGRHTMEFTATGPVTYLYMQGPNVEWTITVADIKSKLAS